MEIQYLYVYISTCTYVNIYAYSYLTLPEYKKIIHKIDIFAFRYSL